MEQGPDLLHKISSHLDGLMLRGTIRQTTQATMPKATTCLFNGGEITIAKALRLREQAGTTLDFECIECNKPVKPHRAGGHTASHFEHYDRNYKCDLSHT